MVAIGVVQEQHPDRARLYQQWRRLGWPVFVDALNLLDHEVVPIPMALDEAGVVWSGRVRTPADLKAFLAAPPNKARPKRAPMPYPRDADRLFHAGKLDDAIDQYKRGTRKRRVDPRDWFRLGVALRRRAESDVRKEGDAQAAVDAWVRALALRPRQYIWRRRIQQYGPTLTKPYNMYGWVEEARTAIRVRGETPVRLAVEPRGSELIGRGGLADRKPVDRDPKGTIERDTRLVLMEVVATPRRVRPGQRVRLRLLLRVKDAWWNNEADPLRLFVKAPAGLRVVGGTFEHAPGEGPESREERVLECELEVGTGAKGGAREIRGYVLFNVCKDKEGVCLFRRKDVAVTLEVDPRAPRIQ